MILVAKIAKWLIEKATRVILAVLVLFILFFGVTVLLPMSLELTSDLRDKQEKVEQVKSQQIQLAEEEAKIGEEITANQNFIENKRRAIALKLDGLSEECEDLKRKAEALEESISWGVWFVNWFGETEVYKKKKEIEDQLSAANTKIQKIESSDPSLSEDHRVLKHYEDESQKLQNKEKQLAEQNELLGLKLSNLEGSITTWGRLYIQLCKSMSEFKRWLLWIVAGILLAPILWSIIMFYLVAPIATKQPPIKLVNAIIGGITWGEPRASLNVELGPSEKLWVRNELLTQHDGVSKHTALFWNKWAPAVSTLSGLVLCTKVENAGDSPAKFTLSSNEPEEEISGIVLEKNAAIVFHVTNIVAISGDVTVSAHWRIWNLNAWLTGQLRFLVFKGPGSIFVGAPRGVEGCKIIEKQFVEQHSTVGFDGGLNYSVKRTETFVPYLRGSASLFDDYFEGRGIMFRKNAATHGRKTFLERTFGSFFAIIGKMLGF